MRPVTATRNQYPGINAHLHSQLQAGGRWHRFHNYHIGQLMAALKAQLLPLGYTAEMEESLQIRRLGDAPHHPRADVLLLDQQAGRPHRPATPTSAQTSLTVEALVGEADYEAPYYAVAVYERRSSGQADEPVAWLELLSPTNKGDTPDAQTYLAKRRLVLESGLVFVELDYLHETPPTFWRLADYSRAEPGSHPYRIVVLDPRPDMRTGPTSVHEFDVDGPLPVVRIPLSAGDALDFDFGPVYHRTFAEGLYGHDVDYGALPPHFDRYSQADRARIACRMLAVLEAARAGHDLEQGPFPVSALPLAEALTRLETLKNLPPSESPA